MIKLTLLTLVFFSSLGYSQVRRREIHMTKPDYEKFLESSLYEFLEKSYDLVEKSCSTRSRYPLRWVFAEREMTTGKNRISVCEKLSEFTGVMEEIDTMLEDQVKTNQDFKDINFVVLDELDNAFYSKELGDLITMPKVFVLYDKYMKGKSKHPKYLYPILMHEYGHYIFERNFGEEVKEAIDKMKEGSLEKDFAYFLQGALHELLADVLAVLGTNDPAAIEDGLYQTYFAQVSEEMKLTARLRNFDLHDNSLEALSRKLRSMKSSLESGRSEKGQILASIYITSVHNFFTPVRHHLWKYVLSNPNYNKDPGKLYKDVAKVMMGMITQVNLRAHMQRYGRSLVSVYLETNELAIKMLQREFH